MKIIALDVHRTFAQVAILENGKIRDTGRLELEREHILKFAKRLNVEDEIVLEATVNTKAIVRLLSPHVNRVVISNPLLVRAIAWAKVKTDKIDASVLAKLHASGFLPEVWMPDEETERLRRVVAERVQLVSQMTRLKNRIHSVLHANLIPPFSGSLFSKRGRAWLEALPVAEDQQRVILRHASELDRLGHDLKQIDEDLGEHRKVWGSCFGDLTMPMLADVCRPGNLPVESSPSRHQPDDLAAGVGAYFDDRARVARHSTGSHGLGGHSSVCL